MTEITQVKLDEIAMHYHDMTGDNDAVSWDKCTSRYRTQVRKMVRNILNCEALASQALRSQGEAVGYVTKDGLASLVSGFSASIVGAAAADEQFNHPLYTHPEPQEAGNVKERALRAIDSIIANNIRDNGTDINRMKVGDEWHTGPAVDAAFRILRGLQQIAANALSTLTEGSSR